MNIRLDSYESCCKNKGAGHHCITAAEWAVRALCSKSLRTQPHGNNYYGRDVNESQWAVPTAYESSGKISRVATGTGPETWSDTGNIYGLWDMNGNVWEWVAGIRLVYGELQAIPFNDAALSDVDTSASSTEWKALNAAATSYDDLYTTPNGSGTTTGSVKLDYVSSHWQWGTTISSKSDSSRGAAFASTTCASGTSSFCRMYLEAMALCPESGDTDYGGDYFYANNGAAERCACRGGYWSGGGYAGVFLLNFNNSRSYSDSSIGGRPAFIEETDN